MTNEERVTQGIERVVNGTVTRQELQKHIKDLQQHIDRANRLIADTRTEPLYELLTKNMPDLSAKALKEAQEQITHFENEIAIYLEVLNKTRKTSG